MITTILLLAVVGCLTAGTYGAIPTVEYHSACDDEQHVYADYNNNPQELGTEWRWPFSISVKIPTMTKVLSVSCLNYGGPAGILGSTVAPDNRITTNTVQWKCSSVYEPGWNTADFDDSKWATAIQVDTNENPVHNGWQSHTDPSGGPTINPQSVYIAAAGVDNVINGTSYCRLKLVYEFIVGCDDFSDFYADGVWIGNQTGFTRVSNPFEIPKLATTFAVKCTNGGAFHAFIGSTADGSLLTDSQWKVYYQKRHVKLSGAGASNVPIDDKDAPPNNWNQPEFVEDSKWTAALQVLDNVGPRPSSGNSAWGNILPHPEISSKSWWISGAQQDKTNDRNSMARDNDRSINYFRRNLACMWKNNCQP